DSFLSITAAEQYPGQLHKLFSYEDVTRATIGNDHVNALIFVMGTNFIERNRDTAVRFMEGYLRSIKALKSDPKAALADWADASKMPIIRKLEAPAELPDDGKVFSDAFRFEAEQARRFGYVGETVAPEAAIDNSLIDDAIARMK